MTDQIKTNQIDLGEGVTATEMRQGSNPLLVKATFTHNKWPVPITLERKQSGNTVYQFHSSHELPKAIDGSFSDIDMAYELLVSSTKGFKFVPKPVDQKTLLQKIEEEEAEAQANVATWEEKYRVDLVEVHESRLADGSAMVILEAREPIALSLKSIKKRRESHYTLQGDEVPFHLKGNSWSTVRGMAKAVSDYVAIEALV